MIPAALVVAIYLEASFQAAVENSPPDYWSDKHGRKDWMRIHGIFVQVFQ